VAKKLVDLEITEVSGVDKAANKRTFLVIKSEGPAETFAEKISKAVKTFAKSVGISKEDGGAKDLYAVLQTQAEKEAKWDRHDKMYELFYPLMESVDSICSDATVVDKIAAIKVSMQQFSDACLASGIVKSEEYLEGLSLFAKEFATIVDKDFIAKSNFAIDSMHVEALQCCVEMVKEFSEKVPVNKSEEHEGGNEMSPEELKKSVDEAVQKALEAKNAENEILKKTVEDLQKAQTEQLAVLRKSQFVNVAKAFNAVDGDSDKLGGILMKCSDKLEKEDYEVLEGIFKSAQERISKGDLLKEFGSGEEGSGNSSEVTKKVEAAAEELRKADASLTKEQAVTKVLSANPKLYAEYSKANR
jgi:hypothetical protein